MKVNGVRIDTSMNEEEDVTLSMILDEIPDGNSFYWKMFFIEITLKGTDHYYCTLSKKIRTSKDGYQIPWNDLKQLSGYIFQTIDGVIIGSRTNEEIYLFKPDKDLYEKYDIFIEMIDGGYWEIFTKDVNFYNNLISKFKIAEYLETDFQEKF